MSRALRILQYGLGPMGLLALRLAAERPELELVGVVDVDPALAGRELADLGGPARWGGIVVSADPERTLREASPELVLHMTGSVLAGAEAQLATILRASASVVSTCEELAYPWPFQPEIAQRLDDTAREWGATLLGTGINPGFLLDALVLALSAPSTAVERIEARRVVDASTRRLSLQRKIGAGLSREEFQNLVQRGLVRHVGLRESVAMVAAGLGWELQGIEESIDPVMAEREVSTEQLTVPPGYVAGIRQVAVGLAGGREVIHLDLQMYVGARHPEDRIVIHGSPPVEMTIEGGVHGDLGTAAMVLNCIPRVMAASPGLVTMKDLPLVMGHRAS